MVFKRLWNRYPIPVLVVEPRASGGWFIGMDKLGAFNKKVGIGTEYKLKKRKDVLDPQRYQNFIQTDKGKMMILYNPSKGVLEPMKTSTYEEIKLKGFVLSAEEIGWKENFMNNTERAYTIFNRIGFMQKYMPLIMLITFGFIMIMTLVVIRQDLFQIIADVQTAVGGLNIQTKIPPLG